jgi:GntR family transcriptional regulator
MTLRQAYDLLEQEHIIHSQRGRGTLISPQRMRKQQQEMRSFSEEIRARGGNPRSRLLSFHRVHPTAAVRDQLSVPSGEDVYRLERIRLSDATPIAIEIVHLPCYLCPELERFDLAQRSLYNVLERDYGLQLARSLETISAATAAPRERNLLQLPRRTAVLVIERTTFTTNGTPVERAVTTYRGDLYQAVVHSVRTAASRAAHAETHA